MTAQEPPLPPFLGHEHHAPTSSPPLEPSPTLQTSPPPSPTDHKFLGLMARRTLGLALLLVTVFLWTASSFLASNIFADDSYSKPYLLTYVNTAAFGVTLLPSIVGCCVVRKAKEVRRRRGRSLREEVVGAWRFVVGVVKGQGRRRGSFQGEVEEGEVEPLVPNEGVVRQEEAGGVDGDPVKVQVEEGVWEEESGRLNTLETAKLSLEFCILWFVANWATAACLKYTTVASSTIITSTSSIWTLIIGATMRVELFSIRKLAGVLASLAGVALISMVDMSGSNDDNRGSFPHKSQTEIAIGDALAFLSAVLYGLYTTVMKKKIGDESRVSMPLFFGLVGVFNVILLWPGFFILHYTGAERFEPPPTGRIWAIVLLNAMASLVSDICWGYAMLLTSPLVVTVGLSLTIPLSLIGQMILNSQWSSLTYWVGAVVVFCSFIFVNQESKVEDEENRNNAHATEEA